MVNDDLPNTTKPRKYRIVTQNHTTVKNLVDDPHTNGMPPSRLPALLSKSSVFPSTSDTIHPRRYRSIHRDFLRSSSPSKIERQGTNIISQTRLPTLNASSNDPEHKRKSDFQRRQIYALNHLMRELEQEQFRQFCQLNGIGTVNTTEEEEVLPTNQDLNTQSTT